jgi:ACS family hexuronate transporter-like MFS transporter
LLSKPTIHLGLTYRATRWLITGWLTLSTILNVIDRQTLAVLAPFLRNRFHISVQGYAHIVAAFMVAYSLMYTFGGRFVDWAGERIGMGACILWWSVCTMLTAFATGALSLGAIRFLLGLGEPGNYPAALRATTRWFPMEERGLPIALFSSGSAVGNTIAAPLIAFLALRFGWRAAFVVPGLMGLLWLAGWLAVYGNPADDPSVTVEELKKLVRHEHGTEATAQLPSWSALLKNRNVLALVLSRFLSDPVSYFYSFWIPEYLMHERGFSLADIGRYAWIPFVAGAIGGIAGGRTSDVLIQKGMAPGRARRSVLYISAAIAPLAIFTAEVKTAAMAIGLMSVMAFVVYCWFINTAAMIPDVVPDRAVGSVLGMIGTAGSAAGVLFTLLVGFLVARYSSYKIVFFIIGSMHLLGGIVLWSLIKDPKDSAHDLSDLPRDMNERVVRWSG